VARSPLLPRRRLQLPACHGACYGCAGTRPCVPGGRLAPGRPTAACPHTCLNACTPDGQHSLAGGTAASGPHAQGARLPAMRVTCAPPPAMLTATLPAPHRGALTACGGSQAQLWLPPAHEATARQHTQHARACGGVGR
jgi:hypothetical protein